MMKLKTTITFTKKIKEEKSKYSGPNEKKK
jgi:hypothetical protein